MPLTDSKVSIKEYWNREWIRRTKGDQFCCNTQKFAVLLDILRLLDIKDKKKLEIGCGICPHAIKLGWNDQNYTGIDLSRVGIGVARANLPQANLIKGDVYNLDLADKYDVFICMDVIEHLPDLMALAHKVRKWKAEDSIFVGNIPLYSIIDEDGAYTHGRERNITYEMLSEFLIESGFPDVMTKQYYTAGKKKEVTVYLPYLFFRGGQ